MEKTIITSCRIISALTFPLLMPFYAIMLAFMTTYLRLLPERPLITVSLVTVSVTIMLPIIAIYIMNLVGLISDPRLNKRKDRTLPFLITIFCYIGLAVYLWNVKAPEWMVAFMIGAASLIVMILCINLVWKISGHAAGVGGITALAFFLTYRGLTITAGLWFPCLAIVVAGVVCSARLLLGRHTLGQVAAGFTLSFLTIYLSMLLANPS